MSRQWSAGSRIRFRIGVVMAIAICLVTSTALPFAGKASASLQYDILQVWSSTSADQRPEKTVTASCPSNRKVIGGGASIAPASDVLLRSVLFDEGLTKVTVEAQSDPDGALEWSVQAIAMCAGGLTGGLTTSTVMSDDASSASKIVEAPCPPHSVPLGVGALIVGGDHEVFLAGLRPTLSDNTGTATAREDEDGSQASWALWAQTICARPLPGLERVGVQTPRDSTSPKVGTASCPDDKIHLSVGAEVVFGGGEVMLNRVMPVRGTTARAVEDDGGSVENWRLRTYAICAYP